MCRSPPYKTTLLGLNGALLHTPMLLFHSEDRHHQVEWMRNMYSSNSRRQLLKKGELTSPPDITRIDGTEERQLSTKLVVENVAFCALHIIIMLPFPFSSSTYIFSQMCLQTFFTPPPRPPRLLPTTPSSSQSNQLLVMLIKITFSGNVPSGYS